jgi:hypothetical protein
MLPPKCSCYPVEKIAGVTLEILPAPEHMVVLERTEAEGVIVDRTLDTVTRNSSGFNPRRQAAWQFVAQWRGRRGRGG